MRLMMWNLFKRRCSSSSLCPICHNDVISVEHVLFFCEWAKVTWFCSPFSMKLNHVGFASFDVWCKEWLIDRSDFEDETRSLMTILCWEIWKCRCLAIFQNKKVNPLLTCLKANTLHAEFWKVQRMPAVGFMRHAADVISKWTRLDLGVLKFNVDGSFKGGNHPAGIGIVVRDDSGSVVDGFHGFLQSFSVAGVEALALLKACRMVDTLQVEKAWFKTDCKDLAVAVLSNCEDVDWRCGPLIHDISGALRSNVSWKLSWVPRQANYAANWVAKQAEKKMCLAGWVCTPPSSLASILSRDLVESCCFGSDSVGVG